MRKNEDGQTVLENEAEVAKYTSKLWQFLKILGLSKESAVEVAEMAGITGLLIEGMVGDSMPPAEKDADRAESLVDEQMKRYVGDAKVGKSELQNIMSGGSVALTMEQLITLSAEAAKRHEEFSRLLRVEMNEELAKEVRAFRENHSLREVAQFIHDKDPKLFTWDPANNQLAGVAACEIGAEILKESAYEPPWDIAPKIDPGSGIVGYSKDPNKP
jgi:hypothetical protein